MGLLFQQASVAEHCSAFEQGHDGLLDMETVFSLLEDGIGMAFEHLGGDFLAAISREAMEDMGFRRGDRHHMVIDLVTGELGGAILGLFFLPHADPDVCVEYIGSAGRLHGIGGDDDRCIGTFQQISGGTVEIRTGKPESESEPGRGPDPGTPHVAVGVPDKSHLHTIERSAQFLDRPESGRGVPRRSGH